MDSLKAQRIDPTEQLGGNPNLGLNVVPTRKGSVEEGMFPTFEEAYKQNNNPFKMNMRNTDLDYVSSRYKNDVLNKAMIDNPNLLMKLVPENNEKLPENFYEVLGCSSI